jgi:hypothetical protein
MVKITTPFELNADELDAQGMQKGGTEKMRAPLAKFRSETSILP